MSKEREKQFQDRLKKFFKQNKDGSHYSHFINRPFFYTPELQASLQPDSPITTRVRTLESVVAELRCLQLDDMQLMTLLADVEDLLEPSVATEPRQAVLSALASLVNGQLEHMTAAKEQVLEMVSRHHVPDDLLLTVHVLSALTDGGRQIAYIEEALPALLLQLLPGALRLPAADGSQARFLRLLANCVKFNAAYVPQQGVQKAVCAIYARAAADAGALDMAACLQLFDVVLCYRDVPRGALVQLTALMARLVCRPEHAPEAWRLMRNLLGTSMGHLTLQVITDLLLNPVNGQDPALLKGCCFLGSMALWGGDQRVTSLLVRPSALLPAFSAALDCNHPAVWHEVALELRALVAGARGAELLPHAWDLLLDLCDRLYERSVPTEDAVGAWEPTVLRHIKTQVIALLAAAEELQESCSLSGDEERLRLSLERCARDRPEASVVASVLKRADFLLTFRDSWIAEMNCLVDTYLLEERRSAVRLAVCGVLARVWEGYRSVDGAAILDSLILPAAGSVATEADAAVQLKLVTLLVRVACTCRSLQALEVVALLERVLAAPLEAKRVVEVAQATALVVAAQGLTEVLRCHLCLLPSAVAVRAYRAMVDHLGRHYAAPECQFAVRDVRQPLLFCLLSLRADCQYRIGLPDADTAVLRFSPHLVLERHQPSAEASHRHGDAAPEPVPASGSSGAGTDAAADSTPVTRLSLAACCQTIITALRTERNFALLSALLEKVPALLENSALVLSDRGTPDVDYFAVAMCQLAADITPALCVQLTETPTAVKPSDLHSLVYPILVSLTSYHNHMTMQMHRQLIVRLESGLRSRCAPQCMTALTVCALGMRDAMARQIGDVLKGMSRLSSTITMGNSVLEFLSTLIRIPRVFSRFTEEQYRYIFAIVLPYTNPAKFNHYMVSLAHHVIAMWFLQCKVPFRRRFVSFIISGLRANFVNIQTIWKQQQAQTTNAAALVNEDSSNRRRSSSLSDRASQPRERRGTVAAVVRRSKETPADPAAARRGSLLTGGGAAGAPPPTHLTAHLPQPPAIQITAELIKFHQELTETCVDLMARYTGSNYAVIAERSPLMQLLLSRGPSSTWVVGNKLVTVTVGGCGGVKYRGTLCEQCFNLCCNFGDAADEPVAESGGEPSLGPAGDAQGGAAPADADAQRRRHISVPVGRSGPMAEAAPMRDDSQLLRDRAGSLSHAEANQQQRARGWPEPTLGHEGGGAAPSDCCQCYCQGWAEVVVRRPSGNMAWVLKLENRQLVNTVDLPVPDLMPVIAPATTEQTMQRLLTQSKQSPSSPPAGSVPTSPSSAAAAPEISIIQEDGDAAAPGPTGAGGAGGEPITAALRRQLARTRSGETRRQALFKSTSGSQIPQGGEVGASGGGGGGPPSPRHGRDRSHTISVMSPTRQPPGGAPAAAAAAAGAGSLDEEERLGLLPEQVFLQLYHNPVVETSADPGGPEPEPREPDSYLLEPGADTERTLTLFDRITPMETHKLGVLYVGRGQAADEAAILRNDCGSTRYNQFLQGLGRLVELTEAQPDKTFLAGLKRDGSDGKFAIMWEDNLMQVLFHVATLMPTVDERCNNKKMHIGNDFVLIVYNESGAEFSVTSIRTQFCYAGVVVEPLDHGCNRITISTKNKLQELFGHTEVTLVSDHNVAVMVRQLALHADLASQILQRGVAGPDPYASNWLERLRMIKRVRRRLADARRKKLAERRRNGEEVASHHVDFVQLI